MGGSSGGTVTPSTGSVTAAEIATGALTAADAAADMATQAEIDLKANIADPTFTGVATAPRFSASGATGATAGARLVGGTTQGKPASGTHSVGDVVVDQAGALWICTVAGTPGTWVPASNGRTRTAYDTFTGTNGTAIASHALDSGGAWTSWNVGLQITSNKITCANAATDGFASTPTSNALSGYCRYTLDTKGTTNETEMYASRVDANNYIKVTQAAAQNWTVSEVVASSSVRAVDTGVAVASGDIAEFRWRGSIIEFFVNGVLADAWVMNAATRAGLGTPSIGIGNAGGFGIGTVPIIDNFEAGTLA